jgi:hypothetical protein
MVMPTGNILLTLGEAIPCSDQEGVELDLRSFYGKLFHLMTKKFDLEAGSTSSMMSRTP